MATQGDKLDRMLENMAAMQADMSTVKEDMHTIKETLYTGNGKPPLLSRVSETESKLKSLSKKAYLVSGALLTGLITLAVAFIQKSL